MNELQGFFFRFVFLLSPHKWACFAFLTFEKKFHVACAHDCAEGQLGVSACVEALLSGHIPFPWTPGTAGKAPWDLPGASCDCGSQRLLALLQLQVGGVP